MKIAKEIPNSYSGTNIGWKALSIIVTLPEEQKQEELSKDLTFNHLDIDKDFTNKFMKVAKRLSNLPTLANETPKTTTWSHLRRTALHLNLINI